MSTTIQEPSASSLLSVEHALSLKVGIVGAGSFAGFAAKAFLSVPGIEIVAVSDSNAIAAKKLADELNAKGYDSYEAFLNEDAINAVYIATPPYLHFQQSRMALVAGKHVICEKPAALKTAEAEELKALASSLKLLYVVNLMQRYNPLYAMVKMIIREKLLGEFLHGFFENYASDENLSPDHWFWDEEKSGGIFIEHGVHFFDMFTGWLGKGKVICAVELQRPGLVGKLIDRAQATVLYPQGIVNFYHGFDQPTVLDRQELRLLFEKGELTLYEWVPVRMKLHGLLQKNNLQHLSHVFKEITVTHESGVPGQAAKGRFKDIAYDNHVTIEYADTAGKQARYQQLLTAFLKDQWQWIRDRDHVRVVDDTNAVESTRMAQNARQISQPVNAQLA